MNTELLKRCLSMANLIGSKDLARDIAAELERSWTPCVERLPTVSGSPMLHDGERVIADACYWIHGQGYDGETQWADLNDEELTDVIAWMPWPEPYGYEK